jgi:hypothetical protein
MTVLYLETAAGEGGYKKKFFILFKSDFQYFFTFYAFADVFPK